MKNTTTNISTCVQPGQFLQGDTCRPVCGGSDILVEPADLDLLLSGLASVVKHFKVYPDISHVSWLVGTEAAYRSWAVDALNLVAKYNQ